MTLQAVEPPEWYYRAPLRYYRKAGLDWAGKAQMNKITFVFTSSEFRLVQKSDMVLSHPGSGTTA